MSIPLKYENTQGHGGNRLNARHKYAVIMTHEYVNLFHQTKDIKNVHSLSAVIQVSSQFSISNIVCCRELEPQQLQEGVFLGLRRQTLILVNPGRK